MPKTKLKGVRRTAYIIRLLMIGNFLSFKEISEKIEKKFKVKVGGGLIKSDIMMIAKEFPVEKGLKRKESTRGKEYYVTTFRIRKG